jgi:hypothetical protein
MKKIILITFVLWCAIAQPTRAQSMLIELNRQIDSLTKIISAAPTNDDLLVQRGNLYHRLAINIGRNAPAQYNEALTKAYTDGEAAYRLNDKNHKALGIMGDIQGIAQATDKATMLYKEAARLKSLSNIVGYLRREGSEQPFAIVVKGDARGNPEGFGNEFYAKAFAKTQKGSSVIALNQKSKRWLVFEAIVAPNTPSAVKLAETPLRNALRDSLKVVLNYEAFKIKINQSLYLYENTFDKFIEGVFVRDVVDAAGLSLVSRNTTKRESGMKGISTLLSEEVLVLHLDEAMAIYQYLDRLNANSNDLEVVKANRKRNLKVMCNSAILKSFVEQEMTRWNYTEADKVDIRKGSKDEEDDDRF